MVFLQANNRRALWMAPFAVPPGGNVLRVEDREL